MRNELTGADSRIPILAHSGTGVRVGVLFFMLFMMMCVAAFAQGLCTSLHLSRYVTLLTSAAVQDLVAFCVPAAALAWMVSRNPYAWLRLDTQAGGKNFVWMAVIFAVALPALNQLIYWNEHLSLPASFASLEVQLRDMETSATEITGFMLQGSSVGTLVANVLVIGCLTGFSEELFFRGALQRTLSGAMNRHTAIWTSAFIFSAMHLQFYGFLPRLLLGAFFGYLYLWCGSLWLNAAAHALNNSLVVVSAWLAASYGIGENADMWGVQTQGFPVAFLIRALIVTVLIYVWRKYSSTKKLTSHG